MKNWERLDILQALYRNFCGGTEKNIRRDGFWTDTGNLALSKIKY
jgi:hypothetical protein